LSLKLSLSILVTAYLLEKEMLNGLVNTINHILRPTAPQQTQPLRPLLTENPFATTPFITVKDRNPFYGKNAPVAGGYFAGYYNGKPNIVGRKLFINV
jgi:hypothetical protein